MGRSQWGSDSVDRETRTASDQQTHKARTTNALGTVEQAAATVKRPLCRLSSSVRQQRGQTAAAGRTRRRRLSWRIVLRLEPTSCRAPMREGSHKHATAAVGAPRARSQLAALRDGARTDAADPATFCEQWSGRKAHARGAILRAFESWRCVMRSSKETR